MSVVGSNVIEASSVGSLARALPGRIQLSRAKGWRKPENTLVVARPGLWGNPFRVGPSRDQAVAVALYEALLYGRWAHVPDVSIQAQQGAHAFAWAHRHELRGKHLACWCRAGTPCHADVLLRFASQSDAGAHDALAMAA